MESKQNEERGETGNVKVFAVLGYLIPILFFLPLLNDKTKHDNFARFHASQQLILLLVYAAFTFTLNGFMMSISLVLPAAQVLNLLLVGLALYSAYFAYLGETKELPLIGHFRLLE